MSLIGSLEDLSLGDILQIISLSQKSGVLSLRASKGEGRICFRGGLVCAAATKLGPSDLRGLLVAPGFVPVDEFEAAASATEGDAKLGELLVSAGVISRERFDALAREAVEAAVVEMFQWRTGEFSFDVREIGESDDPRIVLPVGVNAQYLAMEAARCGDEGQRGAEDAVPGKEPEELSAHAMFGVEPERGEVAEAAEAAEPVEPEHDEKPEVACAVELVASAALDAADAPDLDAEVVLEAKASPRPAPDAAESPRPVVAIDEHLPVLEWTKSALAPTFERVHIFQRSDLALTRIRQYLARGTHPVVLLSPETPGDPLSGIRDARDFVKRLKQQAPRICIAWLHEDGAPALSTAAPADAVVIRPASHQLRPGAGRAAGAPLASELANTLRDLSRGIVPARSPARAVSPAAEAELEELRCATQHLREASSRGEVLPLALDFAARRFRRVAMLVVRDGRAFGIAQRNLSLCGGPDDAALRALELPIASSSWLSRVLETRRPTAGPPRSDGDRALALALGDRLPEHAYLAPVESGGRVVAIVYGDDLPGSGVPADASALEVVLHHAGLALDRAALERALAEADGPR